MLVPPLLLPYIPVPCIPLLPPLWLTIYHPHPLLPVPAPAAQIPLSPPAAATSCPSLAALLSLYIDHP